MADRTGLTGAKDAWDATMRPPLVAVARTTSDVIYGAVYAALNTAETAANSAKSWVADRIKNLMDAIWNGVSALFTARQKPQPTTEPNRAVPSANENPPAAR